MGEVDRFEFAIVNPDEMSPRVHREIDALAFESIAIDFPSRSLDERKYFIETTGSARNNLNDLVGGLAFTVNQRFDQTQYILAYDKKTGRLEAAVPAADNVSARSPWPLNKAEMAVKLKYDALASNRTYWLGLCIMSKNVRASLRGTHPEDTTVTDAMIAIGSARRAEDQPGRAYPYFEHDIYLGGEQDWVKALDRMGYEKTAAVTFVPIFGNGYKLVQQEQMKAVSVRHIQQIALAKFGMPAALQSAGVAVERL